jgi:phosphoribosylaminoimidazolecarboxamide formyltransferase/IMP cyclohydrolase
VTLADAVEEIDIGGVALLRAAAKNHESVTVICDPDDYASVAETFLTASSGEEIGPSEALRLHLALKAFRHTADYDAAIAAYLSDQVAPSQGQRPGGPES